MNLKVRKDMGGGGVDSLPKGFAHSFMKILGAQSSRFMGINICMLSLRCFIVFESILAFCLT